MMWRLVVLGAVVLVLLCGVWIGCGKSEDEAGTTTVSERREPAAKDAGEAPEAGTPTTEDDEGQPTDDEPAAGLAELPEIGETLTFMPPPIAEPEGPEKLVVAEVDQETLDALGAPAYPNAIGCLPADLEDLEELTVGLLTRDSVAKVAAFYEAELPQAVDAGAAMVRLGEKAQELAAILQGTEFAEVAGLDADPDFASGLAEMEQGMAMLEQMGDLRMISDFSAGVFLLVFPLEEHDLTMIMLSPADDGAFSEADLAEFGTIEAQLDVLLSQSDNLVDLGEALKKLEDAGGL